MQIRTKLIHSFLYDHNDLGTLLLDAENLAVSRDQNWENETTLFYFSDDSTIEISPTDFN